MNEQFGKYGMLINAKKTKFQVITKDANRAARLKKRVTINVGGKPLEWVDEFVHLGSVIAGATTLSSAAAMPNLGSVL